MRTLYESILDVDFAEQDNMIDILAKTEKEFPRKIKHFAPKSDDDAFTYWWAIRKSVYLIISNIEEDQASKDRILLAMLKSLILLPGKYKIIEFDWLGDPSGWRGYSVYDKRFDEVFDVCEQLIDKDKWHWIKQLKTEFYSAHAYYANAQDYLPYEVMPDFFDEREFKMLETVIYNTVERYLKSIKLI